MIAKKDLKHGAYYEGHCRNATIARWDGQKQHFVHWRNKFGQWFTETICHPEDDMVWDVFEPYKELAGGDFRPISLVNDYPSAPEQRKLIQQQLEEFKNGTYRS